MNRPLTHWWKPSVPSSTPNPRTITQSGSQRTSANTSRDLLTLLGCPHVPTGVVWHQTGLVLDWKSPLWVCHDSGNDITSFPTLTQGLRCWVNPLWTSGGSEIHDIWPIISTYFILSAFYFVSSIKRLNKCVVQNKTLFNHIGLELVQFASLAAPDVCFLNGSWQIAFG